MSTDNFTMLLLVLVGGFVWVVLIAFIFMMLARSEATSKHERQPDRGTEQAAERYRGHGT